MKKFAAIALITVMLAAMLASSVSAGLLWTDNFDSGVFSDADWQTSGTLFTLEPGGPTNSPHLEGWAEAVVQQSSYGDEAPAPRVYGASFAVKCDTWFYDDGGRDADEHWVALWWADHFEDHIGMDTDRIVYTVRMTYETRTVAIIAHGENGASEYFDGDTVLSEWKLPDSVELEMDPGNPTVFSLGMRINGTQIDGFFNDQKVVSATAPIIHQFKCPLLFWNGSCWTGFDNWMVSTPDYNLFNESSTPIVNPGPAETETEKVLVTDTDESGNVVTRYEVRPVANTGTSSGTGTSAKTGDMVVVVVAVMIVAVGSAIVVKKASSK